MGRFPSVTFKCRPSIRIAVTAGHRSIGVNACDLDVDGPARNAVRRLGFS